MSNKTFRGERIISLFFVLNLGITTHLISNSSSETEPPIMSEFSDESNEDIRSRLNSLEKVIEFKIDKRVRYFIKSYLESGRKSTEHILGRSSIYFPIIEEYLELYHVPDQLKYLAVVESGLQPTTTSKVGAAGLWQLMPATAKQYGLRINSYVDERLDVHRSTEVAIRYLSELYARYDDWALAIAAYNCGPGRVDNALKKSKRHTFSAVKKRLPKETQRYVEKFIAVNYAINNYLFYDIHPKYPDYNIQMTHVNKIFKRKSFRQIAKETGISIRVISKLNPSYIKDIIPPNKHGYYLILPNIGLTTSITKQISDL